MTPETKRMLKSVDAVEEVDERLSSGQWEPMLVIYKEEVDVEGRDWFKVSIQLRKALPGEEQPDD